MDYGNLSTFLLQQARCKSTSGGDDDDDVGETGEDGGAERVEREGGGTGEVERREGHGRRQRAQRQDQVTARTVRQALDDRRQANQIGRRQRRLPETSQTGTAPSVDTRTDRAVVEINPD